MFISKKKLEKIQAECWQTGFDVGRKKAVNETRKVFLKLLVEEEKSNTSGATAGLRRAIEIIRKGKR